MIIYDELASFTEKQWKVLADLSRQTRTKEGWPNWYINRGRMSLNPSKSELRRVSWRRAK